MQSRHRQHGISSLAILLIIIVAVFFGTCAIKLLPAYMESFTVQRAVEAVVEQAKTSNLKRDAIRSSLSKQFQVNRVEALALKDVVITRDKGKTIIDASYEKRIPLMFNIDVVLKFDKFVYEF